MGRIAAAIWAAIAFLGAISTVGQLQPEGADIEAMRAICVAAAVCAGITMVFPWRRVPKGAFNVPLVFMTTAIGALAYAEGSVRTDMTMMFTFVVIFAAYFLSWRAAMFQLLLIGAVLGARMFLLDESEATKAEALRVALLLPALALFTGLVALLRKSITQREDVLKAQDMYDFQTGLLSKDELDRVIDSELERASLHARPLSVVALDVSGQVFSPDTPDPEHSARVATMIARSILGRIRVEDRAARLGEFRFAVIAPETEGVGAAAFGRGLVDVVRKRLMTLGYEAESFKIAVGWADYPRAAKSRAELLQLARVSIEASLASGAADSASPPPVATPEAAPEAEPAESQTPPIRPTAPGAATEGGPEAAVG